MLHFNPSSLYQTAQHWAKSIPLRQRHVIEIQSARDRHPVIGCQDHLSRQSPNCSGRRYDDDLVQTVDDIISREHQNGPPLIGKPKTYTSGSRHVSPHILPALRFPSKRFLVRRELVARGWHGPVNGRIVALGRGDQPQKTHALLLRQRSNQRKNVICRQSIRHRLRSSRTAPRRQTGDPAACDG
jgi:hypothetical protein